MSARIGWTIARDFYFGRFVVDFVRGFLVSYQCLVRINLIITGLAPGSLICASHSSFQIVFPIFGCWETQCDPRPKIAVRRVLFVMGETARAQPEVRDQRRGRR